MNGLDLSDVERCTTVARSARSILASFECLACGRSYSRGVGECCSARCRAWIDAGEPPYKPTVVKYTTLKGGPMPIMGEGFAIKCAGCRRIFSSKGLRCCSPICEQNLRHQEDRLATMAEVGMEVTPRRKCVVCAGDIPRYTTGTGKTRRAVPVSRQTCTRKCQKKLRMDQEASPAVLVNEGPLQGPFYKGPQEALAKGSTAVLGEPGRLPGETRSLAPDQPPQVGQSQPEQPEFCHDR
jgi:predicted nucleic acid-binding Zn ribbon protein